MASMAASNRPSALSNFKKSRFKKSLHYDNIAEMPVFNLLELHGSLCWELDKNDEITFFSDPGLRAVRGEQDSVGGARVGSWTIARWTSSSQRQKPSAGCLARCIPSSLR